MKITTGNKIKLAVLAAGLTLMMILGYFILRVADEKTIVDAGGIASSGGPALTSPIDKAIKALGLSANENDGTQTPAEIEKQAFEDQVVKELQKNYGRTIAKKSTQASLLNIKRYILSLFPGEDGENLFVRVIRRAFPDQADAIFDTLSKLEAYHAWLDENAALLEQMSEAEKKLFLWEMRESMFGEDAMEIWSGEMLATDARKKAMQETMALLEQSYDTTIDEKLDMFHNALLQTYENTAEEFVLEYKDMSAKVFLSLESVQEELQQMSPEQRQWEINKVRRQMGFTEEQVEKMTEYDAIRNQRWETGYRYMEERDALVARFEGQELEEKLKAAREKYFNDEAGTIELEENDGFYRFLRPRVYGRN